MSATRFARPGRILARRARRHAAAGIATRAAIAGLLSLALLGALRPARAAGKPDSDRRGSDADVFWRRPGLADSLPASIALLPAASFDANAERERAAAVACATNLSQTGGRWVSAPTSRALLSAGAAGDSLVRLARASVLKNGRVDSLLAPVLCARLRVQAVLSLRLDSWDTQTIEPSQSGKPWSRGYLRAALVDSVGRLLWSAAGGETAEGLYHEAQSSATGVESSSPRSEFVAGEGAPPLPLDVFSRVLQRWAPAFPSRRAVAR